MNIKKMTAFAAALAVAFSLSACNKNQNDTGNAGNVSRETTASKTVEKSGHLFNAHNFSTPFRKILS